MASPELYCEICGIQFLFKSKYLRHLKSTSHQRLQRVLNVEYIEESTDHDVAMEIEVTQSVISEDASSEATTSDDNDLDSFANVEVNSTTGDDIELNDFLNNEDDELAGKLINSLFFNFPLTYVLEFGDVIECINESSQSQDYSPFPSAIYALLFMLINSPRPIVSCLVVNYVHIFINIIYLY